MSNTCRHITHTVLGALAVALWTSAGAAQGGTITGRVIDARSSLPVVGATIEVGGTRLAASTGDDGAYRIAGVPAGRHTLAARRIGYTFLRQSVTVSDAAQATVDFALQPAALSLDAVVVTGTAGGEQLRSIGNSVATVDAA